MRLRNSILLFGACLAISCVSNRETIDHSIDEDVVVESFSQPNSYPSLEAFIHREYDDDLPRRNYDHIINSISEREDIVEMLDNVEAAKQEIVEVLEERDHERYTSSFRYRFTQNGPEDVYDLNPRQYLRVHLMLDALQDQEFRNNVGLILQTDIKNTRSEIGGLIQLDNDEVSIYPVRSEHDNENYTYLNRFGHRVNRSLRANSRYSMPEKAWMNPHIAAFHCHVIGGPGPSNGFDDGDIPFTMGKIRRYSEWHGFVFSHLEDNVFNVAYYGGEYNGGGFLDSSNYNIYVVSLGNWEFN